MGDQATTVLYTLTTLAQSCAALAAFVGAVGVFRMQVLRDQRRDAEHDLRMRTHQVIGQDMFVIPIEHVLQRLERERVQQPTHDLIGAAVASKGRWQALVPLQDRTRRALLVLEAWNLGVIGVSLIGFNYVPILARAAWFSYALLVVATGTVLVPLWCVWVWTKRVEQ